MSSNKDFAHQAPGATGVDLNHPARGTIEILDHDQAIIREAAPDGSQRKRIAICGFAASSRGLAPFNDPSYSIWGLNQLYRHIPRADRWYDIHDNWREDNVPGTDHVGWLSQCGIPVYMTTRQPEVPTSVRYPLKRVIERVTDGLDYFTSTVAFMLGAALLEIDQQVDEELAGLLEESLPRDPKGWARLVKGLYGEREIAIFGIDLIVGTEYDCVGPQTRVLTSDLRWVPAGKLVIGDQLAAFDEMAESGTGSRRWRVATVTGDGRIIKTCAKITLEDGTTVVVSTDHPWLTTNGKSGYHWHRTDQLQTARGHRSPSRIVKIIEPWQESFDVRDAWREGYLAAAFDGEAHLGSARSRVGRFGNIVFAQRDNEMAAEVTRNLDTFGFRWSKGGRTSCAHYRIKGGRPEIARFLGQMRPARLLAHFNPEQFGRLHALASVPVRSVEMIGEQEVVALGTSTRTFIAEGLASHNSQKACVEFLLGLASARGIVVRIPPQSALLKQLWRYGYEKEPQAWPIRYQELQRRAEALNNERNQLIAKLQTIDGALQEVGYWSQISDLRLKGGSVKLNEDT